MTEDRIATELRVIREEARQRHDEYLSRFTGLGDAIGETRAAIVGLDAGVQRVDQRLADHDRLDEVRFRDIHSDINGLRSQAKDADGSIRTLAVTAEQAKALHVHRDKDDDRLHGWRQKLTLFALTLVCALLGFALRGLLGI